MFQLIARHLLHTLNIIVVESCETSRHYCPMSVQPLPVLTVTFFQPIVIALFADPLLRTEFPIIQGAIFALLHKLPPLFHSVCFSYLHDFCHPLFLPFSRKTYRKFFDIWEDFRTPFSFVPAVPLLSAYICSVNVGLPPAVKRQRFFATLATAGSQTMKMRRNRNSL